MSTPFLYRPENPPGGTITSIESLEMKDPRMRRWVCRVEPAVRFSDGLDSNYEDGDESTHHLVVSWGREGDTGVFPANEAGGILDMLGFGTTHMGYLVEPDEMLALCGFEVKR